MHTTPTDHGPRPRSRSSRAATTSVEIVRSRSSSTSRQMRTRAAPRRAWSPCARRSAGAKRARSAVSGGACSPSVAGVAARTIRRSIAYAGGLDQLPAEGAQQRVRDGSGRGRPEPRIGTTCRSSGSRECARRNGVWSSSSASTKRSRSMPSSSGRAARPIRRAAARPHRARRPAAGGHQPVSHPPGRVSARRHASEYGPRGVITASTIERGTIRLPPARVRACRVDRPRRGHRSRPPEGRRPRPGSRLLPRRPRIRRNAALRGPGGVPGRRRLPPPHRPEHLGEQGRVTPPPGTTGLYHVAIRYPSRAALARALKRVLDAGITLNGRLGSRRQRGLYLEDPDRNGIGSTTTDRRPSGRPMRTVGSRWSQSRSISRHCSPKPSDRTSPRPVGCLAARATPRR